MSCCYKSITLIIIITGEKCSDRGNSVPVIPLLFLLVICTTSIVFSTLGEHKTHLIFKLKCFKKTAQSHTEDIICVRKRSNMLSEVYLCVNDEGVALWCQVGAGQFDLHRKHQHHQHNIIRTRGYKQRRGTITRDSPASQSGQAVQHAGLYTPGCTKMNRREKWMPR